MAAAEKPSIVIPETIPAAIQITMALTANRKSPSVSKVMGSVNKINNGLTV